MVRLHRDLRPVSGLARQGDDFDQALLKLRDLHLEQLTHQVRMGPTHRDRRALQPPGHRRDVDADASAVRVLLTRNLLLGRQNGLHGAQVDMHHPRVRTLLDDTSDDVPFTSLELAQDAVIVDATQPLHDDLLRGVGRDPAELPRVDDSLANDGAILVELGFENRDLPGLPVQLHASVLRITRVLLVCREHRLFNNLGELFQRDALVALQEAQDTHINLHDASLA